MDRYCVRKDTIYIVSQGVNTDEVFYRDALSTGFTAEQVEILTQVEYDARKAVIPLEVLKECKTIELNNICNRTILGNFKVIINEIEYEFSYDYEAQSRFNGIGVLFFANKISEIEWTAYENGQRVRITLNQSSFDIVTLAALHHQNYNVTKFNQLLQQVDSSTSKEQIEAITWNG